VNRAMIAVLVLLSCVGGSEEPMPQTLTTKVRGLWTSPNEHGEVPPGALVRADDVVLTRDGIAEQRRGQPQRIASPAAALMPYQGRLVVQSGSGLSISDAEVSALTPFVGTFDPVTGRRMRGAEANGNLYVATASGVRRLDAVDGAFVDAGVPSGLDVDAATTGAAGFMPTDSAVGYRVVWGERDANGNLLLGPPSGRGLVSNGSGGNRDVNVSTSIPPGIDPARHFWQLYRTPPSVGASIDPGEEFGLVYEGPAPESASVTQLVRAANVVTATTTEAHGFAAGQIVRLGPGGSTGGDLALVGTSVAATSPAGVSWTTRTIPAGDYRGVARNGSVFAAVGSSVAATSPDGITWTARTIPAGTYFAVIWTGSQFVAVGTNVAATSPDGITWTARTIPAASYRSVAWSGSVLLAVAPTGVAASSPDGITWTARAPGIGSGTYTVIWSGARFVVFGDSAAALSADGISFSAISTPIAGAYIYSAATGGTTVVAVGGGGNPAAMTSGDGGLSWTVRDVSVLRPDGGGDLTAIAWTGTVFVAIGSGGLHGLSGYSSDGATWTPSADAIRPARALATSGVPFGAGERAVASTPSATTFTYAEAGANGTLSQPQTATPLTAAITDTIPATFTGATLYTSPSQEGALAAQYEPPIARDVAEFRGSLLWLGTTAKAALEVWMLAVDSSGASSGIRAGDTITINGMIFTAGASESASTRTFQRYTAGTPSQNVANTAASLVRVVNRGQGSPVTCRDMASANETPGRLRLEARNRTDSIAVTVSRAGSWAFTNGQEAALEEHANELRWSPKGKPDANPLTAYQRIDGKGDGVRVLALRDSALAIMALGIYRVTGDGLSATNPPGIVPIDLTTEIVAPDSVVALDNLGFGLSSKGVVQISDQGGVTLLSRAIEDQIRPLLVEPMLSTVRTVAFGVANESEGKFYLWVPETVGATQATKAFVYDHHASLAAGEPVWTVRTDDAACGIVHTDGRLYTGTATAIHRERKSLDVTDYADAETAVSIPAPVTSNSIPLASVAGIAAGDVIAQGEEWAIVLSVGADSVFLDRVVEFTAGAATAYKAIPTVVEWAPLIPAPGGSAQFSEATFLFRRLGGAAFVAEFATEIVPSYAGVAFDGVAMGLNVDPAAVNLRTWVPRDQQRASRLKVRFSHAQAWSPMQLEGLSVIWTPTSIRVRR
jgi:hypothetical protein